MSYTTPMTRPVRRAHVYTLQDALDHMTDLYDIDNAGRQGRSKIRAVLDAWRDLWTLSEWTHLDKGAMLWTAASYDTGTIAYTHSTRTVALTGGTFPTDMVWRKILIGEELYPVEYQPSSTTVVLPERSNPGANVASGTSYTALRSEYPLDHEVAAIGPLRSASDCTPTRVTDYELENLRANFAGTPGTPFYYAIRGSQNGLGQMVVDFVPAPTVAASYYFAAKMRPRELRRWTGGAAEHSTGTVAVDAGSTVTGTGTAWTSAMVGCVMRFTSSTTVLPTGMVGVTDRDNPYSECRVVKSVSSATSLILDEAVEGTYSGTKYTIGDPIDVTPEVWNLFLRMCERASVFLIPKMDQLSLRESMYRDALRKAKAADARFMETGGRDVEYVSLYDLTMHGRLDPDNS